MSQSSPENKEFPILDSSNVSIKGSSYRVVLTNRRLILVEATSQITRSVGLSDIQKIKPESSLNGDPSILLFIRSPSGESKRIVFSFIPTASNNRQSERNQWMTELKNYIASFSPQVTHESTFCSNCGNSVVSGSIFCNHCGSRIIPPAQPFTPFQNNGSQVNNNQSPRISTEKIPLSPRNTQQRDVNTPYSSPKDSYNYSLPNSTPRKRFHFSLPSLSSSKLPADKSKIIGLCCGGVIVLVIISAIFSSMTHGSTATTSSLTQTTTTIEEPADAVTTYLFAFQKAGATYPVKIPASSLYDYLSNNVTSKTTKDVVGVTVSGVKTQWNIYDYSIEQTQKDGNRATVTVEIIWQSNTGIQLTRTETIPLVYEDNKWKLDEFLYSP